MLHNERIIHFSSIQILHNQRTANKVLPGNSVFKLLDIAGSDESASFEAELMKSNGPRVTKWREQCCINDYSHTVISERTLADDRVVGDIETAPTDVNGSPGGENWNVNCSVHSDK